MKQILMLAWLALAAAPSTAQTTWYTVNWSSMDAAELAKMCDGSLADDRLTPCSAYILGAFDAFTADRTICAPDIKNLTISSLGIVKKHLREHPEEWNEHPMIIIRRVLRDHYPCKKVD